MPWRLFLLSVPLWLWFGGTYARADAPGSCSSSVPKPVDDTTTESREGVGLWETPLFLPLLPDAACSVPQEGKGLRYRKVRQYGEVTISGTLYKFKEDWDAIKGTSTYQETETHFTGYDGQWYGPDIGDIEAMDPAHEAFPGRNWSGWQMEPDRASAKIPYWGEAEHYGSDSIELLSPVCIDIQDPVISHNVYKDALKKPDGTYRATKVTGHIKTCPGKYRIILYYKEYPIPDSPPSNPPEQKVEDEVTFKADEMTTAGYPVTMPLPTTECTRTEFQRMEYQLIEGCGDEPAPTGNGNESAGSVQSITHLGRLSSGRSAGSLYLHRPAVTAELFTPRVLEFLAPPDDAFSEIIRDSNGALRQLRSQKVFVDITPVIVTGPVVSGYKADLYPLSDVDLASGRDPVTGLYALESGASTLFTISFDNPDAPTVSNASATKFRVTRQYAGEAAKVSLFENISGGLALTQAGGLLRVEKLTSTSGTDTTVTEKRFSSSSATVPDAVTARVTRHFPFGDYVVETSRGTGTNRVWTTYTYDETTSSASYGLLLSTLSSDGAWQRYEYYSSNRELRYTWSPLGDAGPTETSASLLRCIERVKTSVVDHPTYGDGELLTFVEKAGGVEVSRRHRFICAEPVTLLVGPDEDQFITEHVIESRALLPGDTRAWDASGNELTHFYRGLAGEQDGEILRQDNPDGSVMLRHFHAEGSVDDQVAERWEGVPNSARTDIVAGTRTVTKKSLTGLLLSETVRDVATESGGVHNTGLLIDEKLYADHDSAGRPQTVSHLDGSEETRGYSPCCGQLTSVSRHGITTIYQHDELGRLEWERIELPGGSGPVAIARTVYTRDAAGRVLTRSRVPYTAGTAGTAQLLQCDTYDDAGRLLSTATPGSATTDTTLTRVTTYGLSYNSSNGRSTRTTTQPDGATLIEVTDRAGRLLSRTGTAAAPVRYEYGTATLSDAAQWGLSTTDPLPFTREIKLTAAEVDTSEKVTTTSDYLGRPIKTRYEDEAAERSFYDETGRLARRTDPTGVQTLYRHLHDAAGEAETTILDLTNLGTPDYGSTDRITRTTTTIATHTEGSVTTPVRRITTEVWTEADTGSAAGTTINVQETSLDGLQSWHDAYGQVTHTVVVYNATNGTRTETTTAPDATQVIRVYEGGRLKTETRKDSAGTAVAETAYGYDSHGRLQVVSALQSPGSTLPAPNHALVTTYTYYADDRVASVRTPDPDTGASGDGYDAQTTSYHYDDAGRVDIVTLPDDTTSQPSKTYTSYWPTGQVKRSWGSRSYPSEYSYDAQGRVKTLTTWKDFAGATGTAVTTWNYHSQRGWLQNKRYADNVGPDYTYDAAGRLKTRSWARTLPGTSTRIATVYTYAAASGDLTGVNYTGSTPNVSLPAYDRLGRPTTVTDASGTRTLTYYNGRLDDESWSGGLLAGRAITRTPQALGGVANPHNVDRPGTLAATGVSDDVAYGYDSLGRLATITQGGRVATLAYKPLAGTLQSVTTTQSSTERVKWVRSTDQLGRIGKVDVFLNAASSPAMNRSYTYNAANQRTEIAQEGSRRWAYGYDALGQIQSAQKQYDASATSTPDWQPLPGYSHAFAYDDIGNRKSATTNGRLNSYTSDSLNRYLARGTSLLADVRGSAASGATVLVNDELATRTGEDFYAGVPVLGLKENALKIQAATASPQKATTQNRSVLVPAVPEAFTYDADGNLLQDGLWNYEWDAENRLTAQELRSDVATTTWKRLEYGYDREGRRVQKKVKTRTSVGGAWTTASDTRFLYDGWNLIAEYSYASSTFTLLRSHAWGLDLSETPQGAGGVGGLLWTNVASTVKTYVVTADANGNIIAYIDCADGSTAGKRDYGPFGEALVTTGVAGSLPFAFSSKYEEKETGLYYYGLRYYNPSTGRWLSRDPIEERGGLNLYGMLGNGAINWVDPLGLKKRDCNVLIRMAHGVSSGDDSNRTHLNNNPPSKYPCGDGVFYSGCGANGWNGAVMAANPSASFPMPEDNPSSPGELDGKPYEGRDWFETYSLGRHGYNQAVASAKERCQGCCKKITITVKCDGDMSVTTEEEVKKSTLGKLNPCGKSITYDCATGQWSQPNSLFDSNEKY